MNAELLIPVGVAVVAILAAVAAFTIAWRRSSGDEWRKNVARETLASDRSTGVDVTAVVTDAAVAEAAPDTAPEAEEPAVGAVAIATTQRVVEVSPEEAGVTRRTFLNRALSATFLGGFLGTQALAFLSFLWPKVSGGFGSDVVAGKTADLLAQAVNPDGTKNPVFVPEARAYVLPASSITSEQFDGRGVDAGGLIALFQRCVHLGCRVPWCQTSQGFECPCHGSKYNSVGEYFAGPAPRNLDRFVVEITDSDDFIIKTGSIIETPRAIEKSVEYPLGPSCIGG